MAQYLTTGEDLTSIANAIRTASGENSPLVYPTGFVNKIGELSKYTWFGANPTVEWESDDIVLSFADTTLSSWTPSTTAAAIFTPASLTSSAVQLDHDRHYAISYEIYTNYIYTEIPSVPHAIENYYVGSYHFGARPNSVSNFQNNIKDWVTYAIAPSVFFQIYTNSNGSLSVTNNTYGIYFGVQYPRLSNQNKPIIGCNVYEPSISARAHNDYMRAGAFDLLDLDNSNIHIKVRIYGASENTMSAINDRIKELYNINHNIT